MFILVRAKLSTGVFNFLNHNYFNSHHLIWRFVRGSGILFSRTVSFVFLCFIVIFLCPKISYFYVFSGPFWTFFDRSSRFAAVCENWRMKKTDDANCFSITLPKPLWKWYQKISTFCRVHLTVVLLTTKRANDSCFSRNLTKII